MRPNIASYEVARKKFERWGARCSFRGPWPRRALRPHSRTRPRCPPASPSALSRSSSPCPLCSRPSALSRSRSGRSRSDAKPNDLQECPRRHIGEGRAGLRRADRAVDQAMALERGDDVAADLAPRQPGNLPSRDRLQISDRSQREGLRPGQLGNVVRSKSRMRSADRRGEARFGVQRIAAGDKGEIVRAAAQLVDEIGDQIVEPAAFADQADERLARHGFLRRRRWRLRPAASIRASGRLGASRRARRRGLRLRPVGDGAQRRS